MVSVSVFSLVARLSHMAHFLGCSVGTMVKAGIVILWAFLVTFLS